VFALRLGAPMVFGVALRQPSGRYQLTFEPIDAVDTGNRDADVDRIVVDYTRTLERWVLTAPEQYLWHHRRWKHQRPGTPADMGDPL
jgi:KDO2-lipid IV(A) lauroyltransferase